MWPLFASLLLSAVASNALADTIEWTDPNSGNFNDPNNWTVTSGAGPPPPGATDRAVFDVMGTYSVTFTQNEQSGDLWVRGSIVSFLSDSGAVRTYDITSGVADAIVRDGSTLNIGSATNPVFVNVGDIMNIGTGTGSGTLVLSGANSRLDVLGTGPSHVGSSGHIGILTITNGATANYGTNGTFRIGNSGIATTQGIVTVNSASTLNTGHVELSTADPNANANGTGQMTVDGSGSSINQTLAGANLTIGFASGTGTGTLNVDSGGTFTTGTGTTTIYATGTISINGGTFNANGNINVDGGTITRGGAFNSFNLATGLTLTATNGAQINFGGEYEIDPGTTFDIQSGADFSTTGFLDIGDFGGDGTLLVDGAGSSVTTGTDFSFWGASGNTADVTFRNGATGNLGEIRLARSSTGGTTGIFNIETGATVTMGNLLIVTNGGASTSGTITVDGGTSSLTQNGASFLTVGHSSTGTATINVQNDGTFNTGTGLTTVSATGTINVGVVGSGTFNANGNVNVDSGTINLGSTSLFNLATGITLTATNDAQINFGGGYILDRSATFDIQSGADFSTTSYLDIGNGGDGTLIVDGVGSSLSTGAGFSHWGVAGQTADVTFRNGATGNLSEIRLAPSPTGGTTGIFRVESGATVTTGTLKVATVGGASTSGTITVDGGTSSLTQNGASTLTVGHSSTGTATINVQNGGTFNTGTGTTTVNATGTISITDGTFNANGSLTMSGGSTLTLNGGALNAAAGLDNAAVGTLDFHDGTLTVSGGSFVPNAGGIFADYSIDGPTGTEMPHLVISGGATANIGDDLIVGEVNRGELTVSNGTVSSGDAIFIGSDSLSTGTVTIDGAGSAFTSFSSLYVGFSGNGTLNIQNGGTVSNSSGNIGFDPNSTGTATGTATVDGAGSNWMNSFTLTVGKFGNGTLNIQNGGMVSASFVFIGSDSLSTGTATVDGAGSAFTSFSNLHVGFSGNGTLNIQNGGTVSNISGFIGFDPNSAGTVTVDGSDPNGNPSTWMNSGDLFVGRSSSAAGGTGNLTVKNQGLVDVTGTLKISNPGTVTLSGGTIAVDILDIDPGGTMAFNFGTLNFTNNLAVEPGDSLQTALGGSHTVSFGQVLQVDGTTTLNTVLTIGGGTFFTADLVNPQLLQFNSGTLGITGAGGLTIGAAGPFGSSLSIGAGQNLEVTNTLTVDAGATLSLATGGNILATSLDNSGVVNGSGAVTASLLNQVGGVVHVQLGDQLGFTNTTHTNDGDFQLQGGRINFGGSLTNSATGNILGRGTLEVGGTGLTNEGDLALSNGQTDIFGDVANQTTGRVIISGNADVTFWDDVTDSGTLFNVSTGSSATFFGTAGFGIFGGGDVFFEDDVTPGSSPGLETFGGNVHFGVLSILEIEIAGTVPGSEFDVLNVLGDVTLGGTLDVSLLNPFSLSPGLSFEIIDIGGSLSGSFLGLAEGGLVGNFGGTNLLITYAGGDGNDVTLLSALPGDFDIDGDVDGFDFLEWQRGESPDPLSQSDLNYWKANYGMIAPLAATSTAVPEPSSSALLLTVLVCVTFRRRS